MVSNVNLAMASNVHLAVSSNVFNLKRITGTPKYLPVSHHYLECFLNVSGTDVCRLFGIHLDELLRAINWHGLLFWPLSQLVVDADAETSSSLPEQLPVPAPRRCQSHVLVVASHTS